MERAGPGRGGLLDDPVLLQLLELRLGRLQLLVIKIPKLGSYRQPCGDDAVDRIMGDER
jgi:hypothetical protein